MPIYAPTLPPRPEGEVHIHPLRVLFRFEWQRLQRTKVGRFFGFIFVGMFITKLIYIYVRYLLPMTCELQFWEFTPSGATERAAEPATA